VIIPKNWSLFAVNIFVAGTNIYQCSRLFLYERRRIFSFLMTLFLASKGITKRNRRRRLASRLFRRKSNTGKLLLSGNEKKKTLFFLSTPKDDYRSAILTPMISSPRRSVGDP